MTPRELELQLNQAAIRVRARRRIRRALGVRGWVYQLTPLLRAAIKIERGDKK